MQAVRVAAAAAVAAALLCQAVALPEEVGAAAQLEDDFVDDTPVVAKSVGSGRTFSDWSKKFWEWMGYDYDYDYDYEYYYPSGGASQIGYGYPAVGYIPASAGGHHSSYSSYSPIQSGHQFGHPARDDDYDDEWSFTDMMFDMAVTIVPIGILLSALPAGFLTFAIRRRSFDGSNHLEEDFDPSELPLLQAMMENDFFALGERECQMKLFCELTLLGEKENASFMQKALYYIATLTPDFMARRVGLEKLFRTSRAGTCSVYSCSAAYGETPKIAHKPTHTNQIDEVASEVEKEAVEVSKE
ncbi:uncharacterized protein LOC125027882 [Penaeus chinensis]|uniref:uncharacterized protein LOC125027882 n=1 Tax=Penaeus chinensis TaxID=139456 RepID=UPI001FB6AB21|nr:uncharacterized protein LOC125027882 [Penaeus chinensis]